MERKYQIFISSTYIDLINERQLVAKQILDNYHFPIGMEMFSASDKKQWATINATIDSSDIYILLVGYRYGSIDNEEGISFTEKEYNYAVKKGIPVIVFVNDDKLENDLLKLQSTPVSERINKETGEDSLEVFYKTKYDKDQTRIREFREKVMTNRIAGFFNREKPIDVQPAINKKIKTLPSGGWIRQSKLLQHKYVLAILILLSLITTSFVFRELTPIQNKLMAKEPELFYAAKDSNVEYARVIPNYSSLMDETNLGETFRSTHDSFYIMSNAVKVFYDYDLSIDSCIKRGVHFKVLLVDTSTENIGRLNSLWVFNPDEKAMTLKRKKMISDFENSMDLINNIKKRAEDKAYKGSIQVAFYKGPVYYQMWIKDAGSEKGLAHFNIAHYNGFKPHFRVTPQTSPRLFALMAREFNSYWSDSTCTTLCK